MKIDLNSLPDDLLTAFKTYRSEHPIALPTGHTIGAYEELFPGMYYLCNDSGKLTSVRPDGPHVVFVQPVTGLYVDISPEALHQILSCTHRLKLPEEVRTLPGTLLHWEE